MSDSSTKSLALTNEVFRLNRSAIIPLMLGLALPFATQAPPIMGSLMRRPSKRNKARILPQTKALTSKLTCNASTKASQWKVWKSICFNTTAREKKTGAT